MIVSRIPPIDNFFKKGIPDGILIDIFGAHGTGKSQFVLQTAVHTASNGRPVLFQDTTGAFRPERMLEIIRTHDLSPDILDKISVLRITNVSEQINSLSKTQPRDFSCLMIDGVSDLFSFEYYNDDRFVERNTIFLKYMKSLSAFSVRNNITVILTNVVRNYGDKQVEKFGKIVDLFTHVKVKLEKTSDGRACTCFSPFARKTFGFELTPSGILAGD